jgi:hypothetical protein
MTSFPEPVHPEPHAAHAELPVAAEIADPAGAAHAANAADLAGTAPAAPAVPASHELPEPR